MNEFYDSTSGALYAGNPGGGALTAGNQMQTVSLANIIPNQMMNTRATRQIVRQASVAAVADRAQASLTGLAINHTVALSALADQGAAFSPAAEPAVRGLVDNYVENAKARLSGWF